MAEATARSSGAGRAFTRTIVVVLAVPTLQRILPVWMALGVAAAVILGPNGMTARDVTSSAATSPGFAIVLSAAWLLATLPAAHAALASGTSGLKWLRTLPIPRLWWGASRFALLLLVQLPWLVLWARGTAWHWGILAAVAAALAGGLTVVAGSRLKQYRRVARFRKVSGTLWGAHWRAVVRGRGAVLGRGMIVALVAGGFAGLIARASAADAGVGAAIGLAVAAVGLTVAVGGIAAPVVESERGMGWLLESTGTSHARAGMAALGVVVAVAAALGAGFGATLAAVGEAADGATAMRWIGEAVVCGAAFGALALAVARGSWRGGAIDGARVVWLMTLVAAGALLAVGLLGELALVVVVAAGAAAAGRSAARPREEFVR